MVKFQVNSPSVTYGERYIEADYDYCTSRVEQTADGTYKVKCYRGAICNSRSMRASTCDSNISCQLIFLPNIRVVD